MNETAKQDIRKYNSWGQCGECSFQGLVEYRSIPSEDYDDDEALGVMMDATCPACGFEESVLMIIEEYETMLRLAAANDS